MIIGEFYAGGSMLMCAPTPGNYHTDLSEDAATVAETLTCAPAPRTYLTDPIWERYKLHIPVKEPGAWGGSLPAKYSNRTVLEAALWIARTGSPWRDLPAWFGNWNSIYKRFRRWCQKGVFNGDWFRRLAADLGLDIVSVMIDGTFVKAHQHAMGAPKADALTTPAENREAQAIGATRGGFTTKIMVVADAVGRVLGVKLTPGNAYEAHSVPDLLDAVPGQAHELIADKAYDDNATRTLLAERDMTQSTPSRRNRKEQVWYDPDAYGMRHFIENRIAALKNFRGIATRYHKRADTFLGMLNMVVAFVAFREAVTRRQPGGKPAKQRRMAL